MKTARDDAFRSYVLAHRADLLRTATLLTAGDLHLAEDLVQSTLTRLYIAWPQFQRAANGSSYARRALVNSLVDEKRRPWRRERSLPELPEHPMPEPSSPARGDDLNEALRQLPPRMRAVLVFRYFHDLNVAETADALGCTQGTVKSQTARALDHLRALMGSSDPATSGVPTSPFRPATAPATNL